MRSSGDMPMALLRNIVRQFVDWSTACLLTALVGLLFIQVISRYFFNAPFSWTEELARIIFIWVAFLGAFLGLRSKEHISAASLMNRFSPETKALVSTIVSFLIFCFLLCLTRVGIDVTSRTSNDVTPVMQLSNAYIHIIVPISGGLMAIHLLGQFCKLKWKVAALAVIMSISILIALYFLFGRGHFSGKALILVTMGCVAVLIMSGMPIAFSLGISCALFLLWFQRFPLLVLQTRMVGGIDSFALLAVPLFVLAGELMNVGGVTIRLVNLAKVLVGHVRGGLGMVVVVGEYFFSGISGSTAADVSAIGALLIPAMTKAGYKPELGASIVSAASAMGTLVPPCIPMVILGGMTGISVGALFVGGFIPAIVISICIMILIYLQAIRTNLPLEVRPSMKESIKAVTGAIIPLLLPVIIFGGILSGAATPTEVASVAVVYAAIVGILVFGEIKVNQIVPILVRTVIITGIVMFLVGTSTVFSWILTMNQVPQMVGGLVSRVSSSPLVFLLVSNLTFMVMGAILEGLPALLILIPIFLPFTTQFGINQIHFGILAIASLHIGLFLPPIGLGIVIACTFAKIDIGKVIIPFMPYLIVLIIGLVIITAVPWFTLVLPNIFFR
jgi:C4-dicarboxylate transporter, DctM subunit